MYLKSVTLSAKRNQENKNRKVLYWVSKFGYLKKKKVFDIGKYTSFLKFIIKTVQLKCTFFYKTFRGEVANTRLTHHRPVHRVFLTIRVPLSMQPDNGGMFSGC